MPFILISFLPANSRIVLILLLLLSLFSSLFLYIDVPYGLVGQVLPYLIRRAQENSDMLGGVGKELGLIRTELWRRMFG